MSCSKLFFPEEEVGAVRHVFKPISVWKEKAFEVPPADPNRDLSTPVRLGPLEFRIAAKFEGQYPYVLSVNLQSTSVVRAFPWKGQVVAYLRILDATGRKVVDEITFKNTLVSSDMELAQEGKSFDMMDDYVVNDATFLEVLLTVNVEIPSEGGQWWKIPNAVLTAAPPGLATGSLPSPEEGELIIVSNGGDKFPVHRFILEGSSPVYKAMVSTEMREKTEGKINMAIGSKAVKILLNFLYTGGFREEMESLEEYGVEDFLEVVHAGGMYELPLLMKLAGVALLLRCSNENVFELQVRLKKYGEPMRETLISLTDFAQKNIHDMALE